MNYQFVTIMLSFLSGVIVAFGCVVVANERAIRRNKKEIKKHFNNMPDLEHHFKKWKADKFYQNN
jgi:hypothetical protein